MKIVSLSNLWKTTLVFSLFTCFLQPTLATQKHDPQVGIEATPRLAPITQTQEEINETVAATSLKVFDQINKNWTYVAPGSGNVMSTQSKFWTSKWVKGNALVNDKKAQTNVPSLILPVFPENLTVALEDLIRQPASVECTIALTTAKILCLKEILGEEAFTLYAKAFYRHLQTTDGWSTDEFFHELPLQFLKTVQGQVAIPGTITYITNIPHYSQFKPNGNGRGINVFCTNQDKYVGFGEIYKSGPQSVNFIESNDLRVEFNNTGDVELDKIRHTDMVTLFATKPDLFSIARRIAQQKIDFYQFFSLEEINNFIRTDEIYI